MKRPLSLAKAECAHGVLTIILHLIHVICLHMKDNRWCRKNLEEM